MPLASKMQLEFWRSCTHRWNVKTGATRSGKTYMDYYLLPRRLLAVKGKEGLCVILGNTRETVRRNILLPMKGIYGEARVSNIRSDNSCFMFGERVFCMGADNTAHVDKLRGSSIKYCYGDEVTTWNKDVFDMLKSRLDKPYSKFDGTCNPDNPNHWFKKFLESNADIYQQAYTLDDNPFLDPAVAANLKAEYYGTVYYDRYILGKWSLAEGLIYPHFRDEFLYDELPPEVRMRCIGYCAVDYGTVNPTVFLHILFDPETEISYVDREYYYDSRSGKSTGGVPQKSDSQYGEDMLEFLNPDDVRAVIIDPSAASFRLVLRSLGYIVREADNDVMDGIRDTSMLMSLGKLRVNRKNKNILDEFKAYSWDSKAAMMGVERPIKQFDHACDALRYYVRTVISVTRILKNSKRSDN